MTLTLAGQMAACLKQIWECFQEDTARCLCARQVTPSLPSGPTSRLLIRNCQNTQAIQKKQSGKKKKEITRKGSIISAICFSINFHLGTWRFISHHILQTAINGRKAPCPRRHRVHGERRATVGTAVSPGCCARWDSPSGDTAGQKAMMFAASWMATKRRRGDPAARSGGRLRFGAPMRPKPAQRRPRAPLPIAARSPWLPAYLLAVPCKLVSSVKLFLTLRKLAST